MVTRKNIIGKSKLERMNYPEQARILMLRKKRAGKQIDLSNYVEIDLEEPVCFGSADCLRTEKCGKCSHTTKCRDKSFGG
jgi:hypothetical protein